MFKSSLVIAKFLLVASFLVCSVKAVKFRCRFVNYDLGPSLKLRYTCNATVINSGSSSLERVTGVHYAGKSNDDVRYLRIVEQNLTFIPDGITDFFKKLDALTIRGSSLTTISANDLQRLSRLVFLNLYGNQLTSIDGDLFTYTPHLQNVSFSANQIQHIGHDLVTNLNDLRFLYFLKNVCIDQSAKYRAAVLSLASQLSVLCPPLGSISTTTLVTTAPTTTKTTTPLTTKSTIKTTTTPGTTTTEIILAKCLCDEAIEELRKLNHALELQVGSLQVASNKQNRKIQQQSDKIEQLVQENAAFEKKLLENDMKLRKIGSMLSSK